MSGETQQMKTLPHAKQLRAKKCFDRSGVRGKKIPSEVFLDIKILRRELRACVCARGRGCGYGCRWAICMTGC